MTYSAKTIIPKTAAETALISQFADLQKNSAFTEVKGQSFLPNETERATAIAELRQNGLPTRKVESWHYTDMRRLLTSIAPLSAKMEGGVLPPLLANAVVLPVINGKARADQQISAVGIHAVALAEHSKAETAFAVLPAEEKKDKGDIVGAVNTAFARDGWHIDIAAKTPAAVELQNIQNGGQSHSRFPVHIGKDARVTILERQIGDNSESFLSSAAEIKLADGAEVNWIILRERGITSTELNRFQALLGKNAKLTLYIVNAGGHFIRQEVNVDLAGEESAFQLRGINLLSGHSHTDTTMTVRHLVENTTSTEIFRNVVAEEARGVFQGIIRVAKIAQKTDARMACNSLILSDKAEFDAKPELEIFADDVACGHGATVAEIDHDHLFYLMARGIPEASARALLVKAFVGELVEELPEELAETLDKALDNWLQYHFKKA